MTKILRAEYTREALYNLYNARLSRGDYVGALNIIERIKNSGEKANLVCEMYAKCYYALENYERAIDFWFEFLSNCKKGQNAKAYNGLGACFYKLGEKDVAGYYFNLQLKTVGHTAFEYNDVASDFFEEITNYKRNYYIAYPYEVADFSHLINEVVCLIKSGDYKEALNSLVVIPQSSRYYVDGLVHSSIAKYFLGDVQGSLNDVEKAVEIQPNNVFALCNAISLFSSVNDKNKMNQYLKLLIKNDFSASKNPIKVILILCELKKYKKASQLLKEYLLKNPYDINMLLVGGITEYNLKNFELAEKYFLRLNNIEKTYVSKYYLKLVARAKESKNNAKIKTLKYAFDVQPAENKAILLKFQKYLGVEVVKRSDYNKVFEILDYAFNSQSYKIQSVAITILFKLDFKSSLNYVKNLLLRTSVYDSIKSGALGYLIASGFEGEISFSIGNLFLKKQVCLPDFMSGENVVFIDAYSVALAKILPMDVDTKKFKTTANEIYNALKEQNMLSLILDVNALSAVMFELSKVKNIASRREFAKFFDAKLSTIKTYKQIIADCGYSEKSNFELEKLLTEIDDLPFME